jgi:hypothetical protein
MPEHPPACAEWQEQLAAWVVAQIEPSDEARLEGHLATCAACRAEAGSLLAVSALVLSGGPDPERAGAGGADPPADLGLRIQGRIARERRSRRAVVAGLVALAGAAAAVVLVLALRGDPGVEPLPGDEVAFTVIPDGAEVEAVLAPDADGSVVQLTARGLDPEVTYALWLSPPDGGWEDRIPAGTFRPEDDGTVDARLRCALSVEDYGRAWATTPEGEIALDTK